MHITLNLSFLTFQTEKKRNRKDFDITLTSVDTLTKSWKDFQMRVEDAEQAKCKPIQESFALIYLTLQKLGQKNTATLAF